MMTRTMWIAVVLVTTNVLTLICACGHPETSPSPSLGSGGGSAAKATITGPLHVNALGVGWAVMSDGRLREWGGHTATPREVKTVPGLTSYPGEYFLFSDGTVHRPYYNKGVITEIGEPFQKLPPIRAVIVGKNDGEAWLLTNTGTVIATGERHIPIPKGAKLEVPIAGLANLVVVASGGDRACALDTSDEIRCWRTEDSITRVAVPPASDLVGVASRFCFVARGGGAQCFTDNDKPTPVIGLETATKLAMDRAYSIAPLTGMLCGILVDGGVACATIDDEDSSSPKLSAARRIAGIHNATQLEVSSRSACALTPMGGMCWGENDQGQLGDGTRIDRADAVVVAGLLDDTLPPPKDGNDAVPETDVTMNWSGLPETCGTPGTIHHLHGPHSHEVAEFPLVAAYAFQGPGNAVHVRLASYRVGTAADVPKSRGGQVRLELYLHHHKKDGEDIAVDRGSYMIDDGSTRELKVGAVTSNGWSSIVHDSDAVIITYVDRRWICGRYHVTGFDGQAVDSPWAARFVAVSAAPPAK